MKLQEIGEKVAEIATDVKWLRKETERINGSFRRHIGESDKFRRRVTRNTVWRIAHHLGFVIVFSIISFVIYHVFK